ncbi:hypothetical protein DYB28_014788 [Aphanomyces astaci]|uniref:subtilisin n=1 Tax=Aphanomyces astaci TaxID=112090 RepID=A0A9X8H6V3_APHAT|nr:hypothetical protein DYB28_014788 [Aphanomyces astaci]
MVLYRFLALAAAGTAVTAKISVQVHRNLEVAKQSNIRVKFHCGEALASHRRRLKAGASRTETIESVVHSLKEHTRTSQALVKLLLANQVESTAVETIALYLSANKGASYDEVYTALAKNVDTNTLTLPNNTCGEKMPNAQYPNNIYGYGRLNIFKAVTAPLPKCALWTDDFEVIGEEVKKVSQSTAADCCDECHNTPNCNAFTFTRDNGGTCWLKAENKSVNWVYKKGSKSARVLKPNNDLTSCGTLEEDVTYGGPTVTVTYPAKAESCYADCENTPGCKLFVWYGGTCTLKSDKGDRVIVDGAKAGSLPTSSACAPMELNVNYVGHNIGYTSQTSADACCGDCQATSGCNLFVWFRGMCTLKSAMGTNETVDGAKASFLLAGQAS